MPVQLGAPAAESLGVIAGYCASAVKQSQVNWSLCRSDELARNELWLTTRRAPRVEPSASDMLEAAVKCPTCRLECPDGFDFCPECGMLLHRVCSHCGFRMPAAFSFCPQCGASVAAKSALVAGDTQALLSDAVQRLIPKELAQRLRAPGGQVVGERRVVTLLFSDVTGSTAMAEKLDPEVVMEVMNGAFDVLIQPVARYEGTVARLMGDAVLAFFGAPIAHEDDPERACRAALEIVDAAKAYAETLERARGITGFDVRVGIHTGLVVVGPVGTDLRMEYTAMGDAPNLAARLEHAAESGTVLISEETHQLVSSLFETEALGEIEVPGRTEPVSVYRLLEPHAAKTMVRLDSPLVGRRAEFAACQEAVERLSMGVGGILTIAGEAGIGKSRLVAELSKGADASLRWVEGRCLSYGSSTSYHLWSDVLRDLLGVTAEDHPQAVRRALEQRVEAVCPERRATVCPYLSRLMSLPSISEAETEIEGLAGERLKRGTRRAMEMLLASESADRPLVLVCEDLHWADPSSLQLLEALMPLVDRTSLLLICLFRPQTSHRSWQIRETAAREFPHRHVDLWLRPLSLGAGETLLANLLGERRPRRGPAQRMPRIVRERILSCAEGNPFYVEEILRALIDDGAMTRDTTTGGWVATESSVQIRVPNTVQGVLTARIDRLPERTRRVVQMASVIGRIFPLSLLTAIADAEGVDEVSERLDEHLLTLQRHEMIRERARLPEPEYIFKHELTREAAYRGMLRKERRDLHRRVAVALERLFADRIEERVELLAHHWERAEHAEKAIAYLVQAGDQARMAYAHEEAVDFYRRALGFLRSEGDQERAARTLMKLGLVHTAALQQQKAQEAYEEGFGLWEHGQPAGEPTDLAFGGGPLRLAVEEPLTLDPGRVEDDVSAFTTGQLFQGLVEVDEDYNVLPGMANRWEIDWGGTRYLFYLRDDVRWSDGTRLTASDFEKAWKRNLNPATASPVAHLLYVIENGRALGEGEIEDPGTVGVTALDDRTLEVRTEGPTAYLLYLLAHPVTYPLPRIVTQAEGQLEADPETLISNGPYQLLAWERGKKIVLGRNPFYRGRFSGNIARVECPILADFETVLDAYAADRLDAISMINADPDTIARARAAYPDELVLTPQLSTSYVVFRVDQSPFDDVRVRKAFAHAIDRKRLAQDVWQGQCLPAEGGFVPPGMPGHSAEIGLAHDPSLARRLLSEAGYPGGRGFPEVTWISPAGSARRPIVSFLRDTWRRHLDLRLHSQDLEWRAFVERINQNPAQVTLSGWFADYPDPDCLLRVTFHSTAGFNTPSWHHARFDALVEEAAQVTEGRRRMELYREADRILVAEEAVVVPLGYGFGRILVKPWLSVPSVPPVMLRLKDFVCKMEDRGAR